MEQQGLFAEQSFRCGDMIFEEKTSMLVSKAVLLAASGHKEDAGFHELIGVGRQFLKLPSDRRTALLELYAQDKLLMQVRSQRGYVSANSANVEFTCESFLEGFQRLGMEVPPADVNDLWKFARTWQANSFAVERGWALYEVLSRVNHSCSPNAVKAELSNGSMALIAVQPIDAGEEICLSYLREIDLLQPIAMRTKALTNWFACCACTRCGNSEDTTRDLTCLQTDDCPGIHRFANGGFKPCTVCGDSLVEEEQSLWVVEENKLAEVYDMVERNPAIVGQGSEIVLRKAFERAAKFGARSHWLVGRFHDILRDLEQEYGRWSQARLHALGELTFYDAHFQTRPSIARALKRGKLGQIEEELGHRGEAYNQYMESWQELSSILPQHHKFCADMRCRLEACLVTSP